MLIFVSYVKYYTPKQMSGFINILYTYIDILWSLTNVESSSFSPVRDYCAQLSIDRKIVICNNIMYLL